MKFGKKLILVPFLLLLVGCTDASWDEGVSAYNEKNEIVCYSGGKEIFRKTSTGKVEQLSGGGFAFRTTDGEFVKTFADCFVSFKK